jgi:hypothetical protein
MSSAFRILYSLPSTLISVPPYLLISTRSLTFTSNGTFLPLSSVLPVPRARQRCLPSAFPWPVRNDDPALFRFLLLDRFHENPVPERFHIKCHSDFRLFGLITGFGLNQVPLHPQGEEPATSRTRRTGARPAAKSASYFFFSSTISASITVPSGSSPPLAPGRFPPRGATARSCPLRFPFRHPVAPALPPCKYPRKPPATPEFSLVGRCLIAAESPSASASLRAFLASRWTPCSPPAACRRSHEASSRSDTPRCPPRS